MLFEVQALTIKTLDLHLGHRTRSGTPRTAVPDLTAADLGVLGRPAQPSVSR